MKKILSIILALTLIIGLVPTAFADDTVPEVTSVTYKFVGKDSTDRHADVNQDELETKLGVKYFTSFPDVVEGADNRFWAYLGTSVGKPYDTSRFVGLFKDFSATSADTKIGEWLAFKIKVPKSAKYEISGAAYHRKKSNKGIEIYIAPMSKVSIFANESIYGTIDEASGDRKGATAFSGLNISSEYKVGTADISEHLEKVVQMQITDKKEVPLVEGEEYLLLFNAGAEGIMRISSITLTEVLPEPSASLIAESYETYDEGTIAFTGKLTAADNVTDITSLATAVKFESSNPATATVDSYGVVTGVAAGSADITVTYTYNNEEYTATATIVVTEPDKTKTYSLGSKYMTEAAQDLAGIVTTEGIGKLDDMSYANEYSEIENGSWAIADELSNCSMTLSANYWRVTGIKGSYLTDNDGSLAVLKLKVPYTGTYDIKTRRADGVSGADVYMIPVDDVAPEAIGQSYLKAFTPVWREVTCADGEDSYTKRATAHINEGEYYVVFNLNTDVATVLNDKGAQYFSMRGIELAESTGESIEEDAPADITVSAPTIAVTTNLTDAAINVTTLNEIGESFALNAPDMTEQGYTFIGWQRGAAKANGETYAEADGTSKFTDLKQNDIIKVYTNTFLTAVYEKTAPETSENPLIKFWNQDKTYLGAIAKNSITTLPEMSLIGHKFIGWFTAPEKELVLDDVNVDTNAVAKYTEKPALDSSNAYDKVRVNGVDSAKTNYGEAVVCKDDGGEVTHWLRDGKVVSYDEEYTHYIWDATVISSSYAPIEKKPLVVLENTTVDGAYMIEYDGAGKEIVEVGILFGEANSTPVVGSAFDKYVSQRSANHGQLAAKPINESYTVVRGYMIYKDGNNTYVIYSE